MSVYKFYDTDITGRKEFDISGEDYQELLSTCFRYSSTVSFLIDNTVPNQVQIPIGLEKYRIPVTKNVARIYNPYFISNIDQSKVSSYIIKHYRLGPEVQNILLGVTDSIFKWLCGWGYTNPADPAFFRADGSIFFSSVIHDGECTLIPNGDEDVSAIVSKENWIALEKK